MSLLDYPLFKSAEQLYDIRQSKLSLVQVTANEVNKLMLVIAYLKHVDKSNEKIIDKQKRQKLFDGTIMKFQEYDNASFDNYNASFDFNAKNKKKQIQFIIDEFDNNKTLNITTEINQTKESKVVFLNHISSHILRLRERIKELTKKIQNKVFECSICAEILSHEQLFVLSNCKHELCRHCVRKHIFSSMERKREAPKCPFTALNGCEALLSHFYDLQVVLTCEEYQALNRTLNMNSISKLRNIKYCLTPDCEYAIEMFDGTCGKFTKFECQKCEKVYCTDCKTPWHDGFATCQAFKLKVKRKEYENTADKTYNKWHNKNKKKVKQCPGCWHHVEKNEGCNHMTCVCGTEWCWLCREVLEWETLSNHYTAFWHPQYD